MFSIKKQGGNFFAGITGKVLDVLAKKGGAMAADIAAKITDNMRVMQCDMLRVFLFENHPPDMGYKAGYGSFTINRNDLLDLPSIPKGALTFERIKSIVPDNGENRRVFIDLTQTIAGTNLTIAEYQTQNVIFSGELSAFIASCLSQSGERKQEIQDAVGGMLNQFPDESEDSE
jgi:hypothetical protein